MLPQLLHTLALLGSVSLAAAAKNDVVSLIMPNTDEQPLVGEVMGSDGPMTTYAIKCPEGTDPNECGMPPDGLTFAAGPSSFIYEYTFEDYSLREDCTHSSNTWFSCEITNTQSDFSKTTAEAISDTIPYIPITITGTASATNAKTTPASANAADSSAPNSASVTTQPSQTASAEPTSSDNAALPVATGSAAQLLISGACMALALAL